MTLLLDLLADPDALVWALVVAPLFPSLWAFGRMRRRRGLDGMRPAREPGYWGDRWLNPRNWRRR